MTDRVFIAIPSGTGRPDIDHTVSLTDTMLNLVLSGMRPERRIIHGNCYVHQCRDLLTHQFRKSDCSHVFFWDDDVSAPPGALRRLMAYDRDIIVAPYPKKVQPGTRADKAWPYSVKDGIPDPYGLLECDMVATGFLLIKRHVIDAMCDMYADRVYWNADYNEEIVNLFPTGLLPGFPLNANGKPMWWGEDFAFSVLASRAGFKMWMDPVVPLLHAGRNVWRGDFTKNADSPELEARSSAA